MLNSRKGNRRHYFSLKVFKTLEQDYFMLKVIFTTSSTDIKRGLLNYHKTIHNLKNKILFATALDGASGFVFKELA